MFDEQLGREPFQDTQDPRSEYACGPLVKLPATTTEHMLSWCGEYGHQRSNSPISREKLSPAESDNEQDESWHN